MAFYGLNFVFDKRHSAEFGVNISSINGSGVTESSAGSITKVFADSVYRKPTKYFYGTSQDEVLTFELNIASKETITGSYRSKIVNWLTGKNGYRELRVVQDDLQFVYFNCIITEVTSIYVGNLCKGLRLSIECDSPWAWEVPTVVEHKDTPSVFEFELYNNSDINTYTFPILEFTLSNNNDRVSITNISNNNKETLFESLQPNEKIVVDNNIQSIKSYSLDLISGEYVESGLLRSENFNKKFFYLVPTMNKIKVVGELSNIKISYKNARKVGG